MVSKIDSICTTFDSIIRGGHVHRLDFMKIELIRATFDSIIYGEIDSIPPHCVKKMRLDPAQVDARIVSRH